MRIITFTDSAKQKQTVLTEDGETFVLELEYRPIQACFIFNFNYKDKVVINGQRLCFNDNILDKFKNLLPFGIRVLPADVNDYVEYWNWGMVNDNITSDLTNGRVIVALLTKSELLIV
jgi:hypothetical protein